MPESKDNLLPKGPSKDGFKPPDWFWESRRKGPSMSGTVIWVTLRALDLPLQWWFLRSGAGIDLLQRLGANAIYQPQLTTTALGLSPYHSVIFGLAVGSAAKQIYWKVFVADTVMPVAFAGAIAAYNTILNSLNTILALWTLTSQQPTDQSSLKAFLASCPPALSVGLVLYSVGLFTEWYCEIQRRDFKSDPKNKGKPYAGRLFSLARNINYGGYTLWRSGYSLICGGWIWAGIMCSWLAGDFIYRAIPSLDAYCEKRVSEVTVVRCAIMLTLLVVWSAVGRGSTKSPLQATALDILIQQTIHVASTNTVISRTWRIAQASAVNDTFSVVLRDV